MVTDNYESMRQRAKLRRLTLQRKDTIRVHAHEVEALLDELDALRAEVALLTEEVEGWRCLTARAMEHAAEHHAWEEVDGED